MCGVHVSPLRVQAGTAAVTIFPLFSWYHGGWDTEPHVHDDVICPKAFSLCKGSVEVVIFSYEIDFL